jgi:hypothetical protein
MPGVKGFFARTWDAHWQRPPLARELMGLLWMLAVGLLLLPPVIYLGGRLVLGAYLRDPLTGLTGGLGAFWFDYLKGLAQFSAGYWMAALGPWALLTAWRVARRWAWPSGKSRRAAPATPHRRRRN